jgi:formylglycine-generating enzyme required for sulfatase activity
MSRKNVIIYSAVSLTLTLAACFFVIRAFTKNNVHVKDLGDMIAIPAGEVSFQGQTVNVPAFKISKYEVTIAEYAAFLKDLKENPDKAAKVAHPNQPPGKSHVPAEPRLLHEGETLGPLSRLCAFPRLARFRRGLV